MILNISEYPNARMRKKRFGAGEGIRTLGIVRSPVFKTGAVVRLATPASATHGGIDCKTLSELLGLQNAVEADLLTQVCHTYADARLVAAYVPLLRVLRDNESVVLICYLVHSIEHRFFEVV